MYNIVDFSGRFGGKPFLESNSLSVPNIGKKLTIEVRVDNCMSKCVLAIYAFYWHFSDNFFFPCNVNI